MPSPVTPYTILALAPFGPVPSSGYKPRVAEADIYTLDDALALMGPRFWVDLPKDVCPEGGVDVAVGDMAGFKPASVVKNTPYLAALDACRSYLAQARAGSAPPEKAAAEIRANWPGLPLDLSLAPSGPAQAAASSETLDDLLSMVATEASPAPSGSGGGGLSGWQSQVETLLARALAAIFADEGFRTYEASWRAAQCLAKKAGVKEGGRVRLKLCSVSPGTLPDALGALMAQLIEDTPHLALIDHGFDNSPASIELLEQVLSFADTLLVPTVVSLSKEFFRLGSWAELSKLGYLKSALEGSQYVKFRKLRDHPGASRVLVTLNRFLDRAPYGPGNQARPVAFTEETPLWLNPSWAVGTLAARSVVLYGWPSRLADYRNVFLEELAVSETGDGQAATEGLFDENRIMEFMEEGISPLAGGRGKDVAMLPRQAALDGGSFVFQLFFGRIVSHLLKARQDASGADMENPAGAARRALMDLFNQTDQVPPPDLTVEAGEEADGRTPLAIAFTPPKAVMGGERLRFGFGW